MPSENVSLSYYYTSPSKLFEYIAVGLPVIGSNFPEIERVVREYGIGATCNPSDPHDIANAILHVAEDPARYKTFRERSQKASLELAWENEKEKLISLYHNISDYTHEA